MYFDHPEIIPPNVQGDFRFSKSDDRVARFASMEAEVRAVVEGQFIAKKIHAEQMGFKIGKRLFAIFFKKSFKNLKKNIF